MAYVSSELRFRLLQNLAATQPGCLKAMTSCLTGLERTQGLQKAVMYPSSELTVACFPPMDFNGEDLGSEPTPKHRKTGEIGNTLRLQIMTTDEPGIVLLHHLKRPTQRDKQVM